MEKKSLLEGIRIADMTTVVFGPYCTQILSDLGADVVKIEPAEGDGWRRVGTPAKTLRMGPAHMRVNRGKRSVTWDMKTEKGREATRRLIQRSDVIIHNIRSDAVERLGFAYETVKKIRPDIVYVHCVGFGSGGAYAGLQAYDDLIQAGSGIASLLPRVDKNPKPRFLPMLMADKVSGLHALYAVMAALIHRLRTGEGQHVEVPMLEAVTDFTLLEHLGGLTFVPPNAPALYQRQVDPVRQPFKTKDGWISIAPYVEDRWVRFFNASGHPEVLADERLNTPELRVTNVQLMYEKLAEIAGEKTTGEWLELLKKANVPAARMNMIEDLIEDPHLKSVGFFRKRTHPTEGDYLETKPPVRFSARPYPEVRHPPTIGQHTDEVLAELGLGEGDETARSVGG